MNHAQEVQFFQSKKCKRITDDLKGGDWNNEGGLLLLKEFDEKLRFSQGISDWLMDRRNPGYITHKIKRFGTRTTIPVIAWV